MLWTLQVKDPIQPLSWEKVIELQSFISPAQNQALHSSLASIRAEFAESSCCKWQTWDKAGVGQVATCSRGGCAACCACAQPVGCTAAPSRTSFNVRKTINLKKKKHQWVWDEYLCMWENEYHFSHKWISALKLEVGEMAEIILLLNA